ncbi:hypothetical protein [Nostoc sp. UHCC 0926]|uniref:hypothetical protein n=1 Tax=Nostoc sp. UHCC 0926 TaxID=3025190 RepID=UPI00236164A4|nr:hypothetical protein [Nostoc sp. UHCC 0926]
MFGRFPLRIFWAGRSLLLVNILISSKNRESDRTRLPTTEGITPPLNNVAKPEITALTL